MTPCLAQSSVKLQQFLKEQSRPSVSKLTSADVRLATGQGRGQFFDVIGSRHEFCLKDITDYTPEMVQ